MFDRSGLEIGLCPINSLFALAGLLMSLSFVLKSSNLNEKFCFLRALLWLCRDFVLGTAKWPELRVIVNESKKSVVSASPDTRYIGYDNLLNTDNIISFHFYLTSFCI